jgi:hypothetical protein
LHCRKVGPNHAPVFGGKAPQPIKDRFGTARRAIEDNRNLRLACRVSPGFPAARRVS